MGEQLRHQPRLADTRHADERDELWGLLLTRPRQGVAEEINLLLAADQRPAGTARDVDARPRARLDRLPDGNRGRLPLRRDRLVLAIRKRRRRRPVGRLVDENSVHRRSRLEPRGRVDDVARGHPLSLARPGAEPYERLAGRDGDPELELLLFDDPVADREGRADGALGVVLVRGGSAEQRHHGVADELLDRSAVAFELGAKLRLVGL